MTQPLKVNFSKEEASSRAWEVPPSGEYTVNITDGESALVKPGRKNVGKPYWKLTLVVQEGAYSGTTLKTAVMLFDGSLYQFNQLMNSLGINTAAGSFTVPPLDDIIGKTVNIVGRSMPAKSTPDGELPERFEVKGYKPANLARSGPSKSASASLLP